MQKYARRDSVTKAIEFLPEADISRQRDAKTDEKIIPDGYKPVQYAPIPKFDQTAEAVFQTAAVDLKDRIAFGAEVREVVQDDKEFEEDIIKEPIGRE